MSQTFPDIPELEPVPHVIRGLVWTRATMHAIRSGATWLMFVASQVVLISAGAIAGMRLFSTPGALVGGMLGAGLAVYLLFRVIIEWQARRYLRTTGRDVDWRAQFREVIEAQERVDRVVASGKHRDDR
jgi:hypothetical protein